MPSRNLSIVQRMYEVFEAKDYPTFFDQLAPDIHVVQSLELPWGGMYRGRPGAKMFFSRLAAYLDARVTVEQWIDAGERVAAVGRTHGTTHGGGRSFDVPLVHFWDLKDGQVVRLEIAVDIPTMQAALERAA